MPKQVDGFSKGRKDDEEIIYIHDDDGTVVTAEKNRDGEWSATVFIEETKREQVLATGLDGEDAAMAVLVEYMEQYQPRSDTANDSGGLSAARAAEQGDGMMDEMMQDDGGDGLLARASEAGQRIASKAAETTRSALEPSDNGTAASDLFEPADRDGPTALERFSQDRDRGGSSALFDDTMRGGDGPSVFDEMSRDRDGPSAFEKLSDDRDRESRLSRLQNAEDSGDLYGGR
jgi:hypothetical protein